MSGYDSYEIKGMGNGDAIFDYRDQQAQQEQGRATGSARAELTGVPTEPMTGVLR